MANTTTIIRDVTLNYAKVYSAEENPFGKTVFDIQLEFDKDRIDEMKEFGKVRQLSNGNFAINVDRPATNSKGQANTIRVVNAEKAPMTAPIGNGSVGHVMVYSYDWSMQGRSGRKTVLIAVQVTKHVEYNPEGVDFDIVAVDGNSEVAATDF